MKRTEVSKETGKAVSAQSDAGQEDSVIMQYTAVSVFRIVIADFNIGIVHYFYFPVNSKYGKTLQSRWVRFSLQAKFNKQNKEDFRMEQVTLYNGVEVPILGIGTFMISPEDTEKSVYAALKLGYRMIDTANAYMNEELYCRG